MIDKPLFVKKLDFYIDFKDIQTNEDYIIREGIISVFIETETHYTQRELYGYVDSYGKDRTIEEAEKDIVTDMEIIWETMIDNEEYKDFWNEIDFEDEDWIKKEGSD